MAPRQRPKKAGKPLDEGHGAEKAAKDLVAEIENRMRLAGEVATATSSPEVNLAASMGTAVVDSPGEDPGPANERKAAKPRKAPPSPRQRRS